MGTQTKSLFIVEGPAGSGKTFLTRYIELKGIPVVRASLGARQFDVMDAIAKSSVNDYAKLIQALIHPSPVVVVERLVLSQFIYGTLRNQGLGLQGLEYKEIGITLYRSIMHSTRDLRSRGFHVPFEDTTVAWVVMTLTPEALEDRRRNCDRAFPWSSWQEVQAYAEASKHLKYLHETDGLNPQAVVDWMTLELQ